MVGPEIFGSKVNLRPLKTDDLTRRIAWLGDPECARFFTGSLPQRTYGMEDAEGWRRSLEADLTASVWAIETKDGRHIGDIDLHDIDRYQGSAKLTILIGDKDYWGRGYGTDAVKCLLASAFADLKLQRVNLRVYDFNGRAIRCYEKCGFERAYDTGSQGAYPGEMHMVASKDRFMAMGLNAGTVSA